jgi:pyrroline-5-carboxylate reductase
LNTTNALQNTSGTIALAGAGKMGGAMLTGWLAGGLDAARVVVIEPASALIRRTPPPPIRWWWR